ncbi:XYLT [Mytilus coruscus]|uniref:EGF domain-specific O-linked N-acetylglucosamine transferase n=1 Tax=Mytilus coruscus TaxID=42192 RepID=A0A6J8EC55_MYTCO|nr:XYLT [Mytilus coruscus]
MFILKFNNEIQHVQKHTKDTIIVNIPLIGKIEYNVKGRMSSATNSVSRGEMRIEENTGILSLRNNSEKLRPLPIRSSTNEELVETTIDIPGRGIYPNKDVNTDVARMVSRTSNLNGINLGVTRIVKIGATPSYDIIPNTYNHTVHKDKSFYFFKENFTINDQFLNYWLRRKTIQCNGKFQGFANMFVRWMNITIDSSKSRGAYGGEKISQVLRQREYSEMLNPKKGFFQTDCKYRLKYTFTRYMNMRGHLPNWLNVVSLPYSLKRQAEIQTISNFTIAIQRYEYANVYHSMNDIFNVFLLHIFFHKDPKDSIILFADGHPKGHIDPLWETLFGRVIRVRHLKQPVKFREMVWPMLEKFSPLNLFDLKQVSYIDHFRSFVLNKYGITPRSAPNCDNTNVLFIWRHDYLSHPRNPKGKLARKIINENELFNATKKSFPDIRFKAADLALMSMTEQLKLISETDIIIAMHGAGLMLELFLPPKGGLIELLPRNPKNFSKKQYDLFKNITRHIPLHYLQWQNKDRRNEVSDGYTYIPTKIVESLLKTLIGQVCSGGKH